jgi:hypothetical protein
MIHELKMNPKLAMGAKMKEEQLLKDMEKVESIIGKEVFDIEKVEYWK